MFDELRRDRRPKGHAMRNVIRRLLVAIIRNTGPRVRVVMDNSDASHDATMRDGKLLQRAFRGTIG